MSSIRPAAVAGLFYPADPVQLATDVRRLLSRVATPASPVPPKALIVPHAGYSYSGEVAAQAYARLQPLAGRIRRVVLLGPVHRVPVRGLALPASSAFATPLGTVPLDSAAIASLAGLPQVCVSAAAHAQEHSLEVHLPFLQAVLGDFQLVPLAVGDASAAEVAEVLEKLWGGDETLIVISSDLSHFLTYAQAQRIDGASVRQILAGQPGLDHQQACGATPVNGLLQAARQHGLTAELLDLRNSGDTAGDRTRVVGYAAIAFCPASSPAALDATQGQALLSQARDAISRHLGGSGCACTEQPWMQQPAASFVTLTQHGDLRGCIGSLQACRPLRDDVRSNAVAAATRDPRFVPLTLAELPRTRIEVSLLAPSQPLHFDSEQQALAQLRPGIDGLILEYRDARSTFLPQVWESLPQARDFLARLKLKAGLPADFWHRELRLSRYTVSKWQESGHD